jgi:hypothetical protein
MENFSVKQLTLRNETQEASELWKMFCGFYGNAVSVKGFDLVLTTLIYQKKLKLSVNHKVSH